MKVIERDDWEARNDKVKKRTSWSTVAKLSVEKWEQIVEALYNIYSYSSHTCPMCHRTRHSKGSHYMDCRTCPLWGKKATCGSEGTAIRLFWSEIKKVIKHAEETRREIQKHAKK